MLTTSPSNRPAQFTLLALFEFMTICAIITAFSPMTGIAASIFLMLTAFALLMKQGLPALATLAVASLLADRPLSPNVTAEFHSQLIVVVLASLLCVWYCLRGTCCRGTN